MDLENRGVRPQPVPAQAQPAHNSAHRPNGGGKREIPKPFRIAFVALLFAGAALIIALTFSFNASGNKVTSAETKLVKKDQFQALFLNGGQVYFGKITDFTAKFIKVEDIYYLRVQQQVQPGSDQPVQDISLAKLGNELHGPEDVMVINRDQLVFWENLKDDGQVVKAITEYKKNPDAAKSQQTTPQNNTTTTQQNNTSTDTP